MRHVEDLARAAFGRGIARYSAFLSDREQQLAQAALNRAGAPEESCRFEGGWPDAERRVLCLEPEDCYPASPVCCVRLRCCALAGSQLPVHKGLSGQPDGARASPRGAGRHRSAAGGAGYRLSVRAGACCSPYLSGAAQCGPHRGDGLSSWRWTKYRSLRRQSAGYRPRPYRRCVWMLYLPPCCGAAGAWPQSLWQREG